MSAQHLLEKFKKFEGKQLIDCADEIESMAAQHGLLFNASDPTFNKKSIDRESNRLNARVDEDFKIVKFTLG